MPMQMDDNSPDEFLRRVEAFKEGIKEGLPIIGEIARDELVRGTLAGLGENDQPFAPYSPGYAELIESVGGKSSGVVDLRGIFAKGGTKAKKYKTLVSRAKNLKQKAAESKTARRKGAGRSAWIRVTIGNRSFFAQTRKTRARLGLVDTESEMSADLITVTVRSNWRVILTYRPRRESYMITHNNGEGSQPRRPWFSLQKSNVVGAVQGAFGEMFRALIADFNR